SDEPWRTHGEQSSLHLLATRSAASQAPPSVPTRIPAAARRGAGAAHAAHVLAMEAANTWQIVQRRTGRLRRALGKLFGRSIGAVARTAVNAKLVLPAEVAYAVPSSAVR